MMCGKEGWGYEECWRAEGGFWLLLHCEYGVRFGLALRFACAHDTGSLCSAILYYTYEIIPHYFTTSRSLSSAASPVQVRHRAHQHFEVATTR